MSSHIALLSLVSSFIMLSIIVVFLLLVFQTPTKKPQQQQSRKKGCQPKKAGYEYSRRVQNANKKWVCSPGWTDNGCTWSDGKDAGELQCRRRISSSGTNTKTAIFGDTSGGSISEILLSGGKYADNIGTTIATKMWVDQEAGSVTPEEGYKKLQTAVFPNNEFTCKPGDWVRGVTIYSEDGWTSNGVQGTCYSTGSGKEYQLFDAVSKYYPTNPDPVATKFYDLAKKDTGFAYNLNLLSGIAGRGLQSKKGIVTFFQPLVNVLAGGVSALTMGMANIPSLPNYSYFKPTSLVNADTGITGGTVYTEDAFANRIRGLQFTSADGRNVGPIGTTDKMRKNTWSCPPNTVLVGMTPKIAKDEKNRRNTDLVGIQFTCGNPANAQKK